MPAFPMRDPRTGQIIGFVDLFTKLLEERIVFLTSGATYGEQGQGVVLGLTADLIVGSLLYLQAEDPEKDIYLYINNVGGDAYAALAIYDVMRYVKCDVQTICVGMAASAAAVILAAGTKGKRYALPNSRIMIHQPWGGAVGTAADIKIQTEQLLKTRETINRILALHTGQPIEKIERDTDRDFWMSAEEAKAYGIVDEIIQPRR